MTTLADDIDLADALPLEPPAAPLDLSIPHRLHVVGVGGPGMSAVAIALAEMGHDVSGSDLRDQPVLARVRAAGVTVHLGHDVAHIAGVDAVTASTAIPATNIELVAARERGTLVLRRAGMLASICAQARSIAVAGTHGKTTTSSMLMLILAQARRRPSFIIGGDVTDVGTGAQWTRGDLLVVEADESDGTHLELPVSASIVTNVDVDHLDHYGTFAGIVQSFDKFLGQTGGPKVVCAENPVAARLAARRGATTYGIADAEDRGSATLPDIVALDVEATSGALSFDLARNRSGDLERLAHIELPMRGRYNVLNATAAAAMALELSVDPEDIADALARFGGVARRFDVRGTEGGATFVDDYAHIPTEIDAVLRAARESGDGWRRVIAVFQPNRFNRIAEMWSDYRDAFTEADVTVLTDIFPSGTTPIPGVSGKLIVNAVTEAHPDQRVVWLPRREDLIAFVAAEARDGDVCISMGCGDIASFPTEVLDERHATTR